MAPESRQPWKPRAGAEVVGPGTVRFRVWAPRVKSMQVRLLPPGGGERPHPMWRSGEFFEATLEGCPAGMDYYFRLDGERDRPDPVSRHQPHGVHGPSRVVTPSAFAWTDQAWRGISLEDYVIYELHVGLFTPENTFDAAIGRLDYLKEEVGVTAVELMPVGQFPGERNWGYDGVHLYAPQNSYGGPDGLKRLVEACHARGLAVVLDVVYNHLGCEGNYLREFGPYFSDLYRTPWGEAVNFDGPGSDEVRRYFMDNALYWTTEYHIDCLRLDAIHGIFDRGPRHILQDIAEAVHGQAAALGRAIYVLAESDLNDVRAIDPPSRRGWGLDAQWNDDYHHALQGALTTERQGYYADFGGLEPLARAINNGFVYEGQYSGFRGRRFGSSSRGRPPCRFVVFSQNHDQVGNRPEGERLSVLVPFEALKLAAALVLLGPNLPLIFMGEEYGETAPFLYFTSYLDERLGEAVRQGRLREFAGFGWTTIPDPQAPETYERSRPDWCSRLKGHHLHLLSLYRRLLKLRASMPALGRCGSRTEASSQADSGLLVIERAWGEDRFLLLASFNDSPTTPHVTLPGGLWRCLLDTSWEEYGGREPYRAVDSILAEGEPVMLRFNAYSCQLYARSLPAQASPPA
ncbi:MAG: malto-oligosyltrehalose trehalohydrolase [Pseudomonadota bacterium]